MSLLTFVHILERPEDFGAQADRPATPELSLDHMVYLQCMYSAQFNRSHADSAPLPPNGPSVVSAWGMGGGGGEVEKDLFEQGADPEDSASEARSEEEEEVEVEEEEVCDCASEVEIEAFAATQTRIGDAGSGETGARGGGAWVEHKSMAELWAEKRQQVLIK